MRCPTGVVKRLKIQFYHENINTKEIESNNVGIASTLILV
jgi:hypothetical protein